MNWMSIDAALPIIFMLVGVSMLVDVICDGYDLAVGMLMYRAPDAEKDVLVALRKSNATPGKVSPISFVRSRSATRSPLSTRRRRQVRRRA
jgi:hypothetical protein